METNIIYNQDCIEGMSKRIPDNSIDMILADLPYGATQNKWDSIIPLEPLWKQYKRISKDSTAIVLTASQPFATTLIQSNRDWFKYDLVWDKGLKSGFLNANRMPLRKHENILVFYQKLPTYNPQKYIGMPNHSKGDLSKDFKNNNYGQHDLVDNNEKLGKKKYPDSILEFEKPHPSVALHPTQKPVDLFKYLIKTYTNKGDIVLDNVIGSGTTAVAAKALDRRYIGFEQDEEYYEVTQEQISEVQKELI